MYTDFNSTILSNNLTYLRNISNEELGNIPLFLDFPGGLVEFAAGCCILFLLIGIPGNIITIIALARCAKVRNATAFFIINLSLSDLIHCSFDLPLAASSFALRSWPHGMFLCRFYTLVRFALAAVSLLSVTAITINRYILIKHPRAYLKVYPNRNIVVMVVTIWIFSFTMLLPTWFDVWGEFSMDLSTSLCTVIPDKRGGSPDKILFLCAFLLPCVVIIVCYARIFKEVRKITAKSEAYRKRPKTIEGEDSSYSPQSDIESVSSSNIHSTVNGVPTESSRISNLSMAKTPIGRSFRNIILRRTQDMSLPSRKDRRLLTMITAIMLMFFICHLPLTIMKVFTTLKDHPNAAVLSYVLRYITVCCNPIIYVVMSNEYRKAYKTVMKMPKCGSISLKCWR